MPALSVVRGRRYRPGSDAGAGEVLLAAPSRCEDASARASKIDTLRNMYEDFVLLSGDRV
jgi:hypothetical protein